MPTPKKDDLIRLKNSGAIYCVTRSAYTKCFMEPQDHEMVSHGLGEYAGVYGSAIDVVCTKSGRKRTLRVSGNRNIEVISER